METEKKFYDDGLKFSCNQCSFCCRKTPGVVFLEQKDLTALAKLCDVTEDQFIKIYCRWIDQDDGSQLLSLRELSNYDCIFWTKEQGCTVYPARPVQCSTYPFWDYVLKSKESWDKEVQRCPGINQGEVHPKEEIERELAKFNNRDIIKR